MSTPARLTVLCVAGLMAAAVARAQGTSYADGIVAVVNDEVITVYDVARFNADVEKQIRLRHQDPSAKTDNLISEINQNRIQAAHELINQKLIHAQFLQKGYQLPRGLIEQRIDQMATTYASGDWKKFEQILLESGTTLEEVRTNLEKQLAVELLLNQTIDRNIQISPKDVERYFHDHQTEFQQQRRLRLQLIELDGAVDNDPVKRTMGSISQSLAAGESFDALAETYSLHASAGAGGDLGWMTIAELRPEFREGFTAIAAGAISNPVFLDGKTYVLRIAEMESSGDIRLDQVYDQIKSILFNQQRKKRYDTFVSELRSQAYIRLFFKE